MTTKGEEEGSFRSIYDDFSLIESRLFFPKCICFETEELNFSKILYFLSGVCLHDFPINIQMLLVYKNKKNKKNYRTIYHTHGMIILEGQFN